MESCADAVRLEEAILSNFPDRYVDLLGCHLKELWTATDTEVAKVAKLLHYPETLCTRTLTTKSKFDNVGNCRTIKVGILCKPLRTLTAKIAKLTLSNWCPHRDNLLYIKKTYEEFINSLQQAKGDERLALLRGPARLFGLEQVWCVDQEVARKMASLDALNNHLRENKNGEGCVVPGKGVFFKTQRFNDLQPGDEHVVDAFCKQLFQVGTAASALLKLMNIWVLNPKNASIQMRSASRQQLMEGKKPEEIFSEKEFKACPLVPEHVEWVLQASLEVSGSDLRNCLLENKHERIDPYTASVHFCLALLLRRRDDRANNFIVQDDSNHLIGIDNDQALGPVVDLAPRSNALRLNLRSISFLFTHGDNALDGQVKDAIKKMDPHALIITWLGDLDKWNQRHAMLVKSNILTNEERRKTRIPIVLRYFAVSETYRSLLKLQAAISGGVSDKWKLFKALYPPVAELYQRIGQAGDTPLNAEEILFGPVSDVVKPDDPLYQQLVALAPALRDKEWLSPDVLISRWLADLQLAELPSQRVKTILLRIKADFPNCEELTFRSPRKERHGEIHSFAATHTLRFVDTSNLDCRHLKGLLRSMKPEGQLLLTRCRPLSLAEYDEVYRYAKENKRLFEVHSPSPHPITLDSIDDLPHLDRALHLKVTNRFATDLRLIRELSQRPLSGLHSIDFSGTEFSDEGLAILSETMRFNPVWLEVSDCCRLTADARGKLAAKYYQAMKRGSVTGKYCWALCRRNGMGTIRRNLSEALKYLIEAGAQGHGMANYTLGRWHEKGDGVTRDLGKAATFYQASAKTYRGRKPVGLHLQHDANTLEFDHWDQLASLTLTSEEASDQDIQAILKRTPPRLRSLSLHCSQLTDAVLDALDNDTVRLSTLCLTSSHFTQGGIIAALHIHGKTIERLELSNVQLDDNGALQIAPLLTGRLHTLVIDRPRPDPNNLFAQPFSHDGVQSIAQALENLRAESMTVSFKNCGGIEILDATTLNRLLKRGLHLNFHKCTNIANASLATLLENRSSQVESLDLSETSVTDDCLSGLPQQGGELRHLSLQDCSQISDEGCKHLLNRLLDQEFTCDLTDCTGIKAIDLSEKSRLTDYKLFTLVKRWKLPETLETFSLAHCSGLSRCAAITATIGTLSNNVVDLDLSVSPPEMNHEDNDNNQPPPPLTTPCIFHSGHSPHNCLNGVEDSTRFAHLLENLPPTLQVLQANGWFLSKRKLQPPKTPPPVPLRTISLRDSFISPDNAKPLTQWGDETITVKT